MSAYLDRSICLATRHGKERAIAGPFRGALRAHMVVPPDLDTDALGTFSGEIERRGSAVETCHAKARLGMAATGLSLGVANEGSFGPHPVLPFVPGGVETMIFVDDERGIAVTETMLAPKTNYGHRVARSIEDVSDWLTAVGFPTHALVVRPNDPRPDSPVDKAIASRDRLTIAIARAAAASGDGVALVQPDMRAHVNPTRMAAIRELAVRLADRVATPCPGCEAPGWGVVDQVIGLPCESCSTPTTMARFQVFGCEACSHREQWPRRDGLRQAAARHCPGCNP